jgi:hypothetical protein
MTIHEASDFWDEHSFDEFDDVHEAEEIKFSFKRKKYVAIDEDLYDLIRKKAKTLKMPEEALINEWLSERAGRYWPRRLRRSL